MEHEFYIYIMDIIFASKINIINLSLYSLSYWIFFIYLVTLLLIYYYKLNLFINNKKLN